jgi:hypothetical protein
MQETFDFYLTSPYNYCVGFEKEIVMNVVYKSKSELRAETDKALKEFLKRGGTIEVVKARKAPKSKIKAKNSKGFAGGSSGFAIGYPARSFGG